MYLLPYGKDVFLGDWNRRRSDIGRVRLSRTSRRRFLTVSTLAQNCVLEGSEGLCRIDGLNNNTFCDTPVISANAKPIELNGLMFS